MWCTNTVAPSEFNGPNEGRVKEREINMEFRIIWHRTHRSVSEIGMIVPKPKHKKNVRMKKLNLLISVGVSILSVVYVCHWARLFRWCVRFSVGVLTCVCFQWLFFSHSLFNSFVCVLSPLCSMVVDQFQDLGHIYTNILILCLSITITCHNFFLSFPSWGLLCSIVGASVNVCVLLQSSLLQFVFLVREKMQNSNTQLKRNCIENLKKNKKLEHSECQMMISEHKLVKNTIFIKLLKDHVPICMKSGPFCTAVRPIPMDSVYRECIKNIGVSWPKGMGGEIYMGW